MKKYLVFIALITLCNKLSFSEDRLLIVEKEVIVNGGYEKVFKNNTKLTISDLGQISIAAFKHDLIDAKTVNSFEAGKYITMLDDNLVAVDMMVDSMEGVYEFIVFADYKKNKVIFKYDITTSPGELVYIMHDEEIIIFIYSGFIQCYNKISQTSIWSYRWKKIDDYDWKKTIGSYVIYDNILKIRLRNGDELGFDIDEGYLK